MNNITSHNTDVITKIETITPEKADYLIKVDEARRDAIGVRNRPLNFRRLSYYANIMKKGSWRLTHQGIALSKCGLCVDGQHRLHAIKRAGVPVVVSVTRGVDPEIFKFVDVGRARTTADVFAVENIPNASNHSSGINKYFALIDKSGRLKFDRNAKYDSTSEARTHDDVLNFYYDNKDLLTRIYSLTDKYYNDVRILKKSFIYGYFLYLVKQKKHDFEVVKRFYDNLYGLKHDAVSSAPRRLFRMLADIAIGTKDIKPIVQAALFVKTWNAYINGKDVKLLRFSPESEKFPDFE